MVQGLWPVNDAIVENPKELVRYLDAMRIWISSITGGTGPGGPNESIQFNNAGVFGGDANLLWDSGTVTMLFGSSARITADTSNATQSFRFWFNNSVVNGNTTFGIKPNGAAVTSQFRAIDNSDPTAALQVGDFGQTGSVTFISYSVLNAGAQGTLEERGGGVVYRQMDELGNMQLKKGLQRPVVAKTANYTIVETDSVIFCDCTGGSFTLTLCAANIGGAGFSPDFLIKRTDSSANTVTIARAGADTIDGAATYVMGALQGVHIVADGVSAFGVI